MVQFKPVRVELAFRPVLTFGELILKSRTRFKLTFRQLEARTGLASSYLCQLQNQSSGGSRRKAPIHRPSFDSVLRLKKALHLTWDEIEACDWAERADQK